MLPHDITELNGVEDTIRYSNIAEKAKEFLGKLSGKDCPEEDCGEILSPCCNAKMSVVFASFPLDVKCSICESIFPLKTLLQREGIIKI